MKTFNQKSPWIIKKKTTDQTAIRRQQVHSTLPSIIMFTPRCSIHPNPLFTTNVTRARCAFQLMSRDHDQRAFDNVMNQGPWSLLRMLNFVMSWTLNCSFCSYHWSLTLSIVIQIILSCQHSGAFYDRPLFLLLKTFKLPGVPRSYLRVLKSDVMFWWWSRRFQIHQHKS